MLKNTDEKGERDGVIGRQQPEQQQQQQQRRLVVDKRRRNVICIVYEKNVPGSLARSLARLDWAGLNRVAGKEAAEADDETQVR